jgi:single-stranded DNA-specific DHH superfamily exonuclease
LYIAIEDLRALILDHHDPMKIDSSYVVNLNPELYGFSGERDVSGSTATYLLMREVVDLRDSAWMAVVGSAKIPSPLVGFYRF